MIHIISKTPFTHRLTCRFASPFLQQQASSPSHSFGRLYRHKSLDQFLGYTTLASPIHDKDSLPSRLDPYCYTSGRWLRRDETERQSRFIRFDFEALCRRVISLCPGASSITSYDKKEGGFNRVFIFHLNNGKKIIAKLPFSLAGPARLTTNSEVATIKYLQSKTSIPIPKILDWNDDASAAIGSEYIIMEHAPGVLLHKRWPTMDLDQQMDCISNVYRKLKETVDLEFPAYGSLYFAHTPYISPPRLSLNENFCIGPNCGAIYWDCNVAKPRYYHNVSPNSGPWPDLAAFCDGLIDTGISRVPPAGTVTKQGRYQGSTHAHLRLLEYGREVIRKMAEDPKVKSPASPVMFHPDLHKRNIFVSEDDPTTITAFIDWQSTSIEPAFWYADEVPDYARAIPDPTREGQMEPKSEACAGVFNASLQFLTPKLASPRLLDESLFRPFRYCYRTWEDGIVAFRDELVETSLRWEQLGFAGSCPYPRPSPEELEIHRREHKFFQAAHNLKYTLSGLLNCASDGWVPTEDWESTKFAHKELFESWSQYVLENDDEVLKTEADVRESWPFDIE